MREALSFIFGFGVSALLVIAVSLNEPTAMDVYQGKTALKYTYVDSVKVDSVVVFKKEKK